MSLPIEFGAPWGRTLKTASLVFSLLLAVGAVAAWYGWRAHGAGEALLIACLLVATWVGAALCTVNGYVLTDDAIVVKRLGWTTRLPWQGLVSIAGDNEAMTRSLRLFGNGGLLSFTGIFWNRKIGRYRAFATDPSRAVILTYANRKVVITPDDPQRFIMQARTALTHRQRVVGNAFVRSRWRNTMRRMTGYVVTALLLLAGCGQGPSTAAPPPRTTTADGESLPPFVGRVWLSVTRRDPPGTIIVFLPDKTMLRSSCVEGHRVVEWGVISDTRIRWREEAIPIEAEVSQPTPNELNLKVVGTDQASTYVAISVPYKCPTI
jgi:hypothetical protein